MKKIIATICSCLWVFSASAQTLTIDKCREMALQYNKDKKSAALLTEQAEHTMKSTKALFLPDFSLVGFGLYDTDKRPMGFNLSGLKEGLTSAVTGGVMAGVVPPQMGQWLGQVGAQLPDEAQIDYKAGFVYSGNLVMKQPLYMGGKIRAGYEMSKTAVLLAQQNERKTDAEVIMMVDEAYANCVKANELKVVAEKYKALLLELEKNVQSAIKHGMKLKNDEAKVQVKINEVELQIRRAENAQRLAAMNLCHIIGQPLHSSVSVSSEYPVVNDVQVLLTNDVTERPEYAMLDYQAQIAAQRVKMAKSEMLPQVALLAKYGYAHGVEIADNMLLDGATFAAGVTVNIPLYHFGERTHKVKAAKAKQEQAELERQNKAELMQLELSRAANNLDEARLEVELSTRSLATAEESMQLSGQRYKAGEEPLSDYLETQALWQKAYQTQVDAHFQLYLSSVAYLKACGQLVK